MYNKYSSRSRYWFVKAQRLVLRAMLVPLVRWQKKELSEGYTIIIGCVTQLPTLVIANLKQLARQNLTHAMEVILVFDVAPEGGVAALEARIAALNLPIPYRVICYGKLQKPLATMVDWCWVYAWLSWCIGIAAANTRHAVLQDLDAMLIKRDFLEERYQLMLQEHSQFLSTSWYKGNGVDPEDELCTTFELFLDIDYLQKNFSPLDLFSHVTTYKGKTSDFDLFLYAQTMRGKRRRLVPGDMDMVHPAELITQYRYWLQDNRNFKLHGHSLPMLVYFLWLGGETQPMIDSIASMRSSGSRHLVFRGKNIPVDKIVPDYRKWLIIQIERLETSIAGRIRLEVQEYIDYLRVAPESQFSSVAESLQKQYAAKAMA